MHLVNSLAETLTRPAYSSKSDQNDDKPSAFAYLRTVGAKVFPKALSTWALGA